MEIKDIYFPVSKLPVPPDEVDLIRIVILESIFKKGEDNKIKEFRKIYYETTFQGKPVSEGNNYVPAELIPLIFDAKNNAMMMDYAMRGFGFSIIHEVFDEIQDVFQNPYINTLSNNLTNQAYETITETTSENESNEEPASNGAEPDNGEQPSEPSEPSEPSGEPAIVTPPN